MTRCPSSARKVPKKELTTDEIRNGIARLNKRIAELSAFDPSKMTEGNPPELKGLETSIQTTLARIFGEDTADYDLFSPAANIEYCAPIFFGGAPPAPLSEYVEGVTTNREKSLALLQEAVRTLTEDLSELGGQTQKTTTSPVQEPSTRKIFIVHGRAGIEEAVARFLRDLGFQPIILHEQASKGLTTIIEKVEAHSEVGFAVVLLTPDDVGGVKAGDQQRPRARQNVILELGYFIGVLGRARVCALKQGDVELPSDILGIVYEEFDAHGGWKMKLAKELREAKYEVNLNKVGA